MEQYTAVFTVPEYITIDWIVTPVLWSILYRQIFDNAQSYFQVLNQAEETESRCVLCAV